MSDTGHDSFDRSTARFGNWIITVLIVVGCFTGNVLAVLIAWHGDGGFFYMCLIAGMYGFGVAEFHLLSLWAVTANETWIVRMPSAVLLLVLFWASIVIGLRLAEDGEMQGAPQQLTMMTVQVGMAVAGAAVAIQVPMWCVSRFFGWRICSPGQSAQAEAASSSFGLAQIFFGTMLLAAALACATSLFSGEANRSLDQGRYVTTFNDTLVTTLVIMGQAFVNLIIVFPAVKLAFKKIVSFESFMVLIIVTIGLTIAEVVTLILILSLTFGGPPGDIFGDIFPMLLGMNLAQVICILFMQRMLGMVGYRFVHKDEVSALVESNHGQLSD